MKRFLSQREADRCEQAKEPACKCRCGGAKHGAKRVPSNGDYSALPMDDPHYRPPMNRSQIIRTLNDAAVRMVYPRLVNRDDYIRQHGWDAWMAHDRSEQNAFMEAQRILADAKRQVINPR